MLLIPAVDIKGGKAVRLQQGKAELQTTYDDDPLNAARRWVDGGGRRLHIVDLDGAFDGVPKNRAITLRILKEFAGRVEIEIGGGFRTEESITEFLGAGATRCIVGTKALEDKAFLTRVAQRHPGRVNLGIDAKQGVVVVRGWVNSSAVTALELVKRLAELPLAELIYTDVARDGMLEGPNFEQLEQMRQASPFPLIASGGVTTLDQIRRCAQMGCFGAIVGKSLYDGRITLPEALNAAAGK